MFQPGYEGGYGTSAYSNALNDYNAQGGMAKLGVNFNDWYKNHFTTYNEPSPPSGLIGGSEAAMASRASQPNMGIPASGTGSGLIGGSEAAAAQRAGASSTSTTATGSVRDQALAGKLGAAAQAAAQKSKTWGTKDQGKVEGKT